MPTGTITPAHLGDSASHTVYEAELVWIHMATDLALSNYVPPQSSFWFFIYNQPSIRALSQPLRTTPGLSLRRQAATSLNKLKTLSLSASVALVWCPAHVGIQDNETVDKASKAATTEGAAQHLPISLAAVK